MNKIVWFRYDLRLIDNEAFLNATKDGNILPIFIFDEGYFKLEVSSSFHLKFIIESIDELDSKVEVVELSDQNKTDLEKSLDYCKKNSIKKVVILGSTGLREDHSMANVLIASTYSDILQIELITSFYRIIFVRENTKINAHNETVSIISLSSDNKITTSGLKYDLNNEKLKSFSHGISNEVNGDSFTVKAESTIVVFIGIK